MDIVTIFTLFTVLAAVYLALRGNRRAYKLPPGPPALPLLGNILTIDFTSLPRSYCKWAKKYGSIMRVKMGPITIIILNDPVLIKEAFARDDLSSRPFFWPMKKRSSVNDGALGVIFAEGDHWKEHRRFTMQTFRDFGVGKFKMEEKIIEEGTHLIRFLESTNGHPVDTRIALSTCVANVISSVLTGVRYEMDDPKFIGFLALNKENFEISLGKTIVGLIPFVTFIPLLRGKHERVVEMFRELRQFFLATVEGHIKNWVAERNSDYLESYISATKSGNYRTFSTKEIPLLLEDLFEAGYETTTTTLRWAFLLMASHQHVQQKVHAELDATVGRSVIPKVSDKFHLPYTEATLMEIHRFASIVPLGVTHAAAADTVLEGYDIPKGSWVTSNLWYVHHNEELWEQPDVFQPSRFLTTSGEVKMSENLMQFSLGKRRCLGEALARAEFFILFVAIMQKFSVHLPEGIDTADLEVAVSGITADTKPHKLCFLPRTNDLEP